MRIYGFGTDDTYFYHVIITDNMDDRYLYGAYAVRIRRVYGTYMMRIRCVCSAYMVRI